MPVIGIVATLAAFVAVIIGSTRIDAWRVRTILQLLAYALTVYALTYCVK